MAALGSVDALLMGSGFSARFGNRNKLVFPFRSKPLALYTLELACGLEAFEHIYLMWADDAVARLAEGLPVTLIHNTHPELGSRESIRLGVSASDAAYYMFFTCDQPLLDTQTVRQILDARQPGCIVTPSFNGRPGSPTLFSSQYQDELLSLEPGSHARDIKRRHADNVIDLPLDSPLPLWDIDTEQDLQELEAADL